MTEGQFGSSKINFDKLPLLFICSIDFLWPLHRVPLKGQHHKPCHVYAKGDCVQSPLCDDVISYASSCCVLPLSQPLELSQPFVMKLSQLSMCLLPSCDAVGQSCTLIRLSSMELIALLSPFPCYSLLPWSLFCFSLSDPPPPP